VSDDDVIDGEIVPHGGKPPQAPLRDEKGRLMPGHTANPGGMSKAQAAVRKTLEGGAEGAAAELLALTKDPDPKVRLQAVLAVLDRVIGKPKDASGGGERTQLAAFFAGITERLTAAQQQAALDEEEDGNG
jgi:hypothetical protein